jgi:hypothetical protein
MSCAREITMALRGKWHRGKGGYGLAFCPAHPNTRTPALSVKNGRDGRLLLFCHAGCSFLDVLAALRGMGLADGGGRIFGPDPAVAAKRAADEREERARDIRKARAIWAESEPVAGTLAERYLRNRAIRAALPPSLRFHPRCWHPGAMRLPALVAAVTLEGEAEPVAVHRTYLAEPGRKADADPVKAMRGPCAGGAVRLSEGGGPLVVCEGIETGLSLLDALAAHAPRVRAALGTSGVKGLRLPPGPGELVLAPDTDAHRAGLIAAEDLARRAHALGWAVRIMECAGGDDWNSVAMSRPSQGAAA